MGAKRKVVLGLLLGAAAAYGNGCSCSDNTVAGAHDLAVAGDGGADQGVPNDLAAAPLDLLVYGGALTITPPEVTLDVYAGMPAPTQAYTAKSGNVDVTAMATWTVDDATLGSFGGALFTAGTTHGGTTQVHASWQGMTGFATVHIKLHASIPDNSCAGCPAFPPDTTPACTGSVAQPTILYPPDGILVPPNMNVLETQFDPGAGGTLYEIDYQNAVTDVRVLTRCNAITDSKGNPTTGCSYDLSQPVWDDLAGSNRGGDPVTITVRATDASGSCIASSAAHVSLSFGQEDLVGGIYYWQSVAVTGLQGATGGIFRYDFGKRGQAPSAFLAPTAGGGTMQRCIGCHFLSRDGQKMTYGNDDPDADDEYSDLKSSLIDVGTKAAVALNQPGFQAFSPDHARLLASNGVGKAPTTNFFQFNGATGAAGTPALVPTGMRATQPDWSADGAHIVFVQPKNFTFPTYNRVDDNHFSGGSLFTMSFSGGTYGAATSLLASAGENNFYPAYSPDGAFVLFNRVPLTGTAGACTANSCPNDAFSNPAARVMLMPAGGGTPVDLAALNGTGALANSWPRFAPNAQGYRGHQIAWVTFSSIRDYGDVVRNSVMVGGAAQHICYPPESPENTSMNKMVTTDPVCQQPQLWMAAIDLTQAASGGDASYPAFWLPFQEPKAHNHIAQWVVALVGPQPSPSPQPSDGGTPLDLGPGCIVGNGACMATDYCCNGVCCSDHTCGCVP